MKLISPNGVRFSVSDERGEQFLKQGYRKAGVTAPAPVPALDSPKPKRRRKATPEPTPE